MKSLAIMNLKGGCGKTTISTHLAVVGMRLGLVTYILDLDPAPNGLANMMLKVKFAV
jgi:cellulose biosynthesis protein BcsQ